MALALARAGSHQSNRQAFDSDHTWWLLNDFMSAENTQAPRCEALKWF